MITLELNSQDAKVQSQLQEVAIRLQKSRKVVAVTGAGISSDAGIPDFRSKDGLYNMVKHQYPNAVVKGKDLFDTVLFSNPTSIGVFFTFMSSLRKCIQKARPTDTHRFLSRLKSKGKLLRCYTQNIDGLEERTERSLMIGTNPKEKPDVIQLHGDIDRLKCMHCAYECDWSLDQEQLCDKGEAPTCPSCWSVQQERAKAGKRDTGVGSLRPNIVLYGEEHPQGEMIGRCTVTDLKANPDCLVILGTSLKVVGIRKLVRNMAKAVKARGGIVVFINSTDTQSMWSNVMDYHIKGNCDDWVRSLKDKIPNFFTDQSTLEFKTAKKTKSNTGKKVPIPSPPSTPKRVTKSTTTSNNNIKVFSPANESDDNINAEMPLTPASREASLDAEQNRSPLKNITNNIQNKKRKHLDGEPPVEMKRQLTRLSPKRVRT